MTFLSKSLRDYLRVRRGLGFKLQYEGTALADFVKFLDLHGAAYITTELALRWAVQPTHTDPSHWTRRLGMVRLFAQYRSVSDTRTEIPPGRSATQQLPPEAAVHLHRPGDQRIDGRSPSASIEARAQTARVRDAPGFPDRHGDAAW